MKGITSMRSRLLSSGLAFMVTLAMLLAAGCGRGHVMHMNGISVYEHVWVTAVDRLAPQAAHEMQCGEPDLAYVLLQRRGRQPSQILVEGCGQRVIYKRARGRRWVMIAVELPTERQPASPQDPHPAPPPPAAHPG